MPELLLTAESVDTLPAAAASRPLIAEGLVRRGPYWSEPAYEADADNWNALAGENEIHAAISTFNERKEELKSRDAVEFLLARLPEGGRILDLGCGYGRVAKYVLPKRRFEAYVGVDCSPEMLRKFHARYASSEAERATPLVLVHADIDRVPVADASVDAVIVSAVFLHNHKEVTRRAVAEIRRMLAPGGTLIVVGSFPNDRGLTGLQGKLFLSYLKLTGRERKNGPVRYFSREEVEALFRDFKTVEIHPYGFSLLPKTVHGLPSFLRFPYRKMYDVLHAWLVRRVSDRVRERSCVHFDVVARV